MNRQLTAEKNGGDFETMQVMAAFTLWLRRLSAALPAWSMTQAYPPPFNDGLSRAVYLITFFYFCVLADIQLGRIPVREPLRATNGPDQKP